MIDIFKILESTSKPVPFAQVGERIWTDPYVSKQLLLAHLDPNTDAASRRPGTIASSVAWIADQLQLKAGTIVLDLGCGPGLYSQRIAKLGMQVTGVDFSEESIAYARKQASVEKLDIDYRMQNYLDFDELERFDVVLLIYGDYCALCPTDRQRLLDIVRRALKTNGRFILDVSTPTCRQKYRLENRWYAAQRGFWSAKPHILLSQGFDYPEQLIYLDQYIVIEAKGNIRVFRNWFQDFTASTIKQELLAGGFNVLGTYGDLLGNAYNEDSDWVGLILEKKQV